MTASMPGRPWLSIHVFHRGSLDLLLTRTVAPMVGELHRAAEIDGWFFLRYWEGGPHLRLRLLPHSPDHAGEISTRVSERCTRHLADRPSPPGGYRQAEYAALGARLAAAERMSDWDRRLRPDDTVEFVPYRPEYNSYGVGPALLAVERHFTQSSAIAARLLVNRPEPDRRQGAALALLISALAVCEPDLPQAGTGCATAGEAAYQRPSWIAYHDARSEALRRQALDVWRIASGPLPRSTADPLAAWLRSLRSLHARLTRLRSKGGFSPHDTLSPLSHLADALHPDDPTVARTVLRCTHLLCNRLGLPPTSEAQLAFLAAHTLARLNKEVSPR